MPTTLDSPELTTPLDAMYLIHKALRAESARVEAAVDCLEQGGSFKPFQRVFYRWAMALGYHVDAEDRYLTSCIPNAVLAEEQTTGQNEIMARLEGLQTYLHTELGRMMVIPRTQRQLRSKVIALRILQDDLLEDEEEHVLPVMRQRLSEAEQCELMRHLLIDGEAEDQSAILDWVKQDVTAPEQQFLDGLHDVFAGTMR